MEDNMDVKNNTMDVKNYTMDLKKSKNAKKAAMILIACTDSEKGFAGGVQPRAKCDGKMTSDLLGVWADVGNMRIFLRKKGIDTWKVFSGVKEYSWNKGYDRDTVMEEIEKAFTSTKYHDIVLYYSGHGRNAPGTPLHGAWCLKGNDLDKDSEHIIPGHIFYLWRNRTKIKEGRKLCIISDSCYSGIWVEAAKRLGARNVFVQAACRSNEKAIEDESGGVFTQKWINVCQGLYPGHEEDILTNMVNPMFWCGAVLGVGVGLASAIYNAFGLQTPLATTGDYVRVGGTILGFYSCWTTMTVKKILDKSVI